MLLVPTKLSVQNNNNKKLKFNQPQKCMTNGFHMNLDGSLKLT